MKIKAQGLLNAVRWVEEEYGTSTLQEIVRACSPAVRERYVSAIAINWHPVDELVEFLAVAEQVVGRADGKLAEAIGAAGARANLKGSTMRFAFYITRPELLLQRVTNLWRQFNDEGEMLLLGMEDHHVRFEVVGMKEPKWLFCCTLTGWAREVVAATGLQASVARHTDCRDRGAARCVWDIRGVRKGTFAPPVGRAG